MNFLKKSSAKRESFKKRKGLFRICGVLLLLAILAGLAWHYVPMYYARFYLTRAALQTRGKLVGLWGKDQGEGDAYEEALKLVADEVEWNGRSILVLPGGLGISWKEQRDEKNTYAQGSLDVYFLGSIREGIHYMADQEKVVFRIPGITEAPISTTQDTLKEVMGFSIVPQKKEQIESDMETLKKDAIAMMMESRIDFAGRDKTGVEIKARIPASLFDNYLKEAGEMLGDGPTKDLKEWGQLLKERRTDSEAQEVLFTVDKTLNITGIHVEGLGDAALGFESNGGLAMGGSLLLDGREVLVDSKVYFGNGQEGKRSFQISKLNITYHKENLQLGLELSGGYEGGKISSEALESGTLAGKETGPGDGGLKAARDTFLKKIGNLGFDLNKQ
ncbi:MAG: hypothetical protein QM683_05580 [Lacrimispora sp.]